MSTTRKDAMLAAVDSVDGVHELRLVVKAYVDARVDPAAILEDLEQIRDLVSDEDEEKVMDVMDLLTGWCAPSGRLLPPD